MQVYPGRDIGLHVRGNRLHRFDCCTGAAAVASGFRVQGFFVRFRV